MSVAKLVCLCLVVGSAYGSTTSPPPPPTAAAKNPGIIGRFTQSGFNNIIRNIIAQLADEVSNNKLPDYNGTSKTIFGKVQYNVNKINIVQFDTPQADLHPIPGKGLNLKISDAYATVNGHWQYSYGAFFFTVRDSGTFLVSADGIDLDLELFFDMDNSGYPVMSVGNCSAHLDDIDITLSGGASWLYRLFIRSVASSIKADIIDNICGEISVNVGELADKLHAVPMSAPIFNGVLDIDFKLVNAPVFTKDYADISVTGKVYHTNSDGDIPFEAPAINRTDETSKMLYIWITDYVFDTFGYSLYKSGAMQYAVDLLNIDDLIPRVPDDEEIRRMLGLEDLDLDISLPELPELPQLPQLPQIPQIPKESQLHKLLPALDLGIDIPSPKSIGNLADADLFLLFELIAPPMFETTTDGQLVTVSLSVSLRSNDVNATDEDNVVAINMTLQVLIKPSMEHEFLTGVAELKWLRTLLTSSIFPSIMNQSVQDAMEVTLVQLVDNAGLPWLNRVLAKGVEFPVVGPHWQYVDNKITTNQGYMLIETNFGTPPRLYV